MLHHAILCPHSEVVDFIKEGSGKGSDGCRGGGANGWNNGAVWGKGS